MLSQWQKNYLPHCFMAQGIIINIIVVKIEAYCKSLGWQYGYFYILPGKVRGLHHKTW